MWSFQKASKALKRWWDTPGTWFFRITVEKLPNVTAESPAEKYREWSILEIMGHRAVAGLVMEKEVAGVRLLKVSMPATDIRKGVIQYYSPRAIFSLTPTTEQTAIRMRDSNYIYEPSILSELSGIPRSDGYVPRRAGFEANCEEDPNEL